jgi:hypothetical protein
MRDGLSPLDKSNLEDKLLPPNGLSTSHERQQFAMGQSK